MTTIFDSLATIFNVRSKQLLVVAALCLPLQIFAAASSLASDGGAESVGHVQIVLGKAYISSADNARQRIEAGSEIFVGDEITTRDNATVFIRFIDNASVSVRQDSHLQILSYQYDKSRPEESKVKFNLVRGVTRAVSGEAAKSARDQFRLNTPIAAIGVRGTDFVVRATDSTTEAQVNEGIIVLAPFSAECSTDSYGPCLANAVELTGDSFDTIALDNGEASPRVLPAAQDRGSEVLQQEVQSMLASNAAVAEEPAAEPYVEEIFVEEANSNQVASNTTDAALETPSSMPEPELPEPELPEPELPEPELPEPEIPEPVLPDFTPVIAATEVVLKENQLVWGHFADGLGDLERISLPIADASVGREVTVGNFDYILYRDDGDLVRVDRTLGTVNFALNSAQAFYNSSTGVVAMRVVDGSLGIDFQENSFATELNLDHASTGPIDFVAAGSVFDGGFFRANNDSQRIAGAVSFDGQEAGYFFEQQLEGASIEGLTLWNAP